MQIVATIALRTCPALMTTGDLACARAALEMLGYAMRGSRRLRHVLVTWQLV
jgi:hypothetical protein